LAGGQPRCVQNLHHAQGVFERPQVARLDFFYAAHHRGQVIERVVDPGGGGRQAQRLLHLSVENQAGKNIDFGFDIISQI